MDLRRLTGLVSFIHWSLRSGPVVVLAWFRLGFTSVVPCLGLDCCLALLSPFGSSFCLFVYLFSAPVRKFFRAPLVWCFVLVYIYWYLYSSFSVGLFPVCGAL